MGKKLPKCFGTFFDEPRPWHCKGIACPVVLECREYAHNGLNRHYDVAKAWWIFGSIAFALAVLDTLDFINTKDLRLLFTAALGYSATIPFFIYFSVKKWRIFREAKFKLSDENA